MAKKYGVEVIEALSRVVEIEAETYEDAEEIASSRYSNSEIVLDWNDLNGVSYKPYPSQKIKENFSINIDFDKDEKNVFIATENSSGAKYKCETEEDLKIALNSYIDNYIELECVNGIEKESEQKKKRDRER